MDNSTLESTRNSPVLAKGTQVLKPASSLSSMSSTLSSQSSASENRRFTKRNVVMMEDGKLTVEFVEGRIKEGEGIPRRHPLVQSTPLITTYSDEITTLFESFESSAKANRDRPYLGTRRKLDDGTFGSYVWETYNDIYEKMKKLSCAMNTFKLDPNSTVGLYSINRAEWIITEQACFSQSLVTVPLYDTLGDDTIEYICNHVEMNTLFCTGDKLKKIFSIRSKIPALKRIISFDSFPAEMIENANAVGLILYNFQNLLEMGEKFKYEPRPPKSTDLFTICYTSGTTGLPKGVMLTHSALLSDTSAALALCGYGLQGFDPHHRSLFELMTDDCHISYLPLAHIFERIVITALTTVGASIGFYQGDTQKIMEDIAELKPTIFVSVPRLFNRVFDKVKAGVKAQGGFKAFLFNTAYDAKVKNLHENGKLTHWLWDKLVFSSIKAKLGGRVRAMLSGSAPISPEVMDFLRVCFSCEVYEGYGQTETSAATCLTVRHDWSTGHVGIPTPCNEIKLVDVPEMDYTSKDKPFARGEICVRGPNCFIGYFKDEEKTRETIDSDGWVHTGDIGEWDERGRLKIIDRKKNLFKLAQGEYIAPEKVENVIMKSPLISQAFLHGESLQSSTVAVIVPDREALERWVSKDENSDLAKLSYKELCQTNQVKELMMKEIEKFGRKGTNELKGFEIPKALYIENESFSIDNGLLTATFKLKRNEAVKHYKLITDDLYKNLPVASE